MTVVTFGLAFIAGPDAEDLAKHGGGGLVAGGLTDHMAGKAIAV